MLDSVFTLSSYKDSSVNIIVIEWLQRSLMAEKECAWNMKEQESNMCDKALHFMSIHGTHLLSGRLLFHLVWLLATDVDKDREEVSPIRSPYVEYSGSARITEQAECTLLVDSIHNTIHHIRFEYGCRDSWGATTKCGLGIDLCVLKQRHTHMQIVSSRMMRNVPLPLPL